MAPRPERSTFAPGGAAVRPDCLASSDAAFTLQVYAKVREGDLPSGDLLGLEAERQPSQRNGPGSPTPSCATRRAHPSRPTPPRWPARLTGSTIGNRLAPRLGEDDMPRVMADCRRFPSVNNCSLTIIGEEDEVVLAGAAHAVAVHEHPDTPELREQIRMMLEPESDYVSGERPKEPLPG